MLSSSKHSPWKDTYLSFGIIIIAFKYIILKSLSIKIDVWKKFGIIWNQFYCAKYCSNDPVILLKTLPWLPLALWIKFKLLQGPSCLVLFSFLKPLSAELWSVLCFLTFAFVFSFTSDIPIPPPGHELLLILSGFRNPCKRVSLLLYFP